MRKSNVLQGMMKKTLMEHVNYKTGRVGYIIRLSQEISLRTLPRDETFGFGGGHVAPICIGKQARYQHVAHRRRRRRRCKLQHLPQWVDAVPSKTPAHYCVQV